MKAESLGGALEGPFPVTQQTLCIYWNLIKIIASQAEIHWTNT